MVEERIQRRLAAVLAADVVGYSRLMEQDEAGTLAALKGRRKEVLEPLVARHKGRIFKITGDGVLVEFGSTVNAVQCAIELQLGMAAANADGPGDRQIVLRIGVNLGDVMVEGSDLYGDGVNIAARLEGIAEPGGILLSGTAFDHVRNKVTASLEDLGVQNLKNIAEPVRIYRVAGTPRASVPSSKAATDKPSIAVLPFANMSGDAELQHFADGLTEDITTALSRASSLDVIAHTSAYAYKGKVTDVKRIAAELGTGYIIEGSVRHSGDRIRVAAQLIDARTGRHVWAEKYDERLAGIFDVQDQITRAIVASVETQISLFQWTALKETDGVKAEKLALRAHARLYDQTREAYAEATRLVQQALALEPENALAHRVKAWAFVAELEIRVHPANQESFEKAIVLARTAVNLAPREAETHWMLGASYREAGRHEEAIEALQTGLALDPNFTLCYSELALCYMALGRSRDSIEAAETVLRFNPRDPTNHWMHYAIAGSKFLMGDYKGALDRAKQVSRNRPDFVRPAIIWAASAAALGKHEDAEAAVAQCLSGFPGMRVGNVAPDYMTRFVREEDHERLKALIREAGLPE